MNINLYAGIKAYQWQLDTHNYISEHLDEGKIIIIKAARQRYGKSAFAKAELIRHSLFKSKTKNAYVSPTLKLAVKMYDEICNECTDLIKEKNANKLKITFINDSFISLFSAEQGDALRGHTVTGILCLDEAVFIKDDVWNELISSWTTVHKPTTLMISTPKYRNGFFYNYYMSNDSFIKVFDWVTDYECEMDERTLALKDKMPRAKWHSEFLGLFLEADGSVFGNFNDCIIPSYAEYNDLYWGLDFASGVGKDYTVLTALNENGEMAYQWKTNDLQPTDQVNKIVELLNLMGYKKFIAEKNSLGSVYINLLKNARIKVTEFNTSNSSKRRIIENLQTALENKKIKIVDNTSLIDQLTFFESAVNSKTNNVSYNAPSGKNDDEVISLALALEAYNSKNNNFRVTFI